MQHDERPTICDYEGSNYRVEFWEGKGRDYEDSVERIALRKLLPSHGQRLLEIGAGFGRLTNEYAAFDQVVVLDYSLSQLRYAQQYLGRSDRYIYVAADAYQLPFRTGSFSAATMIRVLHHMGQVSKALAQARRVLVPGGTFILEFANKRNLKAMVRYALRKQTWSPYDEKPVEFVELNFDFHPAYVRHELEKANFQMRQQLPVSFFRLRGLKSRVPAPILVGADNLLQYSGLAITPSVFTKNIAVGATPNNLNAPSLFVSPETGAELVRKGDTMVCTQTGQRWAVRDGIYDFKAPLDE